MLKGRHNRQRRARPRTQTFNRLIPNIITVGALCAGLTAVRFAIAEQWEFAMVAVVVAAILDALDGTIARLLKAASNFGAELDSLSDVIAFGVAPGLIIYFWSLSEIGGIGWAAGLFFVCVALCAWPDLTALGDAPAICKQLLYRSSGAGWRATGAPAAPNEPRIRRWVFPASRRNRSLDRSDRFVDGQSDSNLFVEALTRSSTVFLADACPYRLIRRRSRRRAMAYVIDPQSCLSREFSLLLSLFQEIKGRSESGRERR